MISVGVVKEAAVTVRGNGLYDVEYIPDAEGPCKLEVSYAGQPVPNRSVADETLSAVHLHVKTS